MSILSQNLPLQILPLDDNPEGNRYQAILEGLESERVRIRVDESFTALANAGSKVRIEFTMGRYQFRFDTEIVEKIAPLQVAIRKPREIRKSTIRSSPRLAMHTPINYNIWTQKGIHTGTITDLSTVGLKMLIKQALPKNTLLGLTIAIPGKALRFICQGIVRWCRIEPDLPGQYTCGVMFTTLSNEAQQRLGKYIEQELSDTGSGIP